MSRHAFVVPNCDPFLNIGTATSFLTPDTLDISRMKLTILCRTQGRSLSDYMFREGSNVAIHILDNIVLEAAEMVYNELTFIAEKLHKDSVWSSFSTRGSRPRKTLEYVQELISLCTCHPMLDVRGNHLQDGANEILEELLDPGTTSIDWKSCCFWMKKDRFFGPAWSINGKSVDTHILYIESCETFLLLELNSKGSLLRVDIIEKSENSLNNQRLRTTQIFANFLLHFVWQNL